MNFYCLHILQVYIACIINIINFVLMFTIKKCDIHDGVKKYHIRCAFHIVFIRHKTYLSDIRHKT